MHYRAIIIGSGQGGTPLAHALAQAGWKTALVESTHVGGCCINEGCSPTKTMVASARIAYLAKRAADYGVRVDKAEVDLARVRERKRQIVSQFRSSSEERLESAPNVDLVRGEASFTGPRQLEVTQGESRKTLTADTIFINTGCRPRKLSIPGLEEIPVVDSTSIMELDRVPEHLLIVGAGYIALEFGQMFRRFGSAVTLIARGNRLLTREDPDICDAIYQVVQEDGIEVLFQAEIEGVQAKEGGFEASIKVGNEMRKAQGSVLLTAAGRVPNTDELNVESAGVALGRGGFVQVNERLETSAPSVYALGDIKGGPAFTHISYDDYRILKGNLVEGKDLTTKDRFVPYTLFTDPQLGRVGITETEAKARGLETHVASMPMSYIARALEMDESRGLVKAIVDAQSGQILGFAALGIEGGEIMAIVETAMLAKMPYTGLRDATFAHPTLAEGLNTLFMQIP